MENKLPGTYFVQTVDNKACKIKIKKNKIMSNVVKSTLNSVAILRLFSSNNELVTYA